MESRSLKLDAALGVIVITVIALFVWLSVSIGGAAPRGAKRYSFYFDSALGLAEDNDVAVAGVLVGTIEEITVEGRMAKVDVAVSPEVKVFENAKAAVRAKSLLGEKYIDLDPGAEPATILKEGGALRDNVPTIEIDVVIRSVQELVSTLNRMTPALERATAGVDAVLKNTDPSALGSELRRAVTSAKEILDKTNALVDESGGDLQAVLKIARDRGPKIVERLDVATQKADRLVSAIDPSALKKAGDKLPDIVDNADLAAKDVRELLNHVKGNADTLESVLARLNKQLGRLDRLDERTIREFLQVEGVRVLIFPNGEVKERLDKLK